MVDEAAGDFKAVAENRLILSVDRTTGAATIENAVGDPIAITFYKIASPGGHLRAADGRWLSFEDQGLGDLQQDVSDSTHLEELGGLGYSFEVGAPETLGTPYEFTPLSFGQSGDDLTFEYTTDSGEKKTGIIEYTGPANNLVLTVDPETGEAILENQSTFTAPITDYAIGSASGSLTPEDWTSLEDGSVGDWTESSATATTLSEAIATAFAVNAGTTFQLGDIFSLAGERDLTLAFTLEDGTQMNGVVHYGEIASGVVGDTNGDGLVNLDDLNNVRNNFGAGGPAAAVPEPATALLAGVGLLALLGLQNRRGRR